MSRKDFELIAQTIRSVAEQIGSHNADVVAGYFAASLAQTNHGFKPDRFIAACKR
jgi:hypothetical protein